MPSHHRASGNPDERPTAKQQALLRRLAIERGVSFATPKTKRQASQAIRELLQLPRDADSDRRRETKAVLADLANRGGASAVRDDEIVGYGSSARWERGS